MDTRIEDEKACLEAYDGSQISNWETWKKAWMMALEYERTRVMERDLAEMDHWYEGREK